MHLRKWTCTIDPIYSLVDQSRYKNKTGSLRQCGGRTKHLFDSMARAFNWAKGSPTNLRLDYSARRFGNEPETQHHINVACTHSPIVEMRRTLRRKMDKFFFQSYRYQFIPTHRWIIPLLDYLEDNLWADSKAGRDIWNGRRTCHLLASDSPDFW